MAPGLPGRQSGVHRALGARFPGRRGFVESFFVRGSRAGEAEPESPPAADPELPPAADPELPPTA